MTGVLVDAALRSKLHGLNEPLELCDESGHVLARVGPVPDLSEYEPLVNPGTQYTYFGSLEIRRTARAESSMESHTRELT